MMNSIDRIKNDLENDDIFALYQHQNHNQRQVVIGEDGEEINQSQALPDDEWLDSSTEEGGMNELDMIIQGADNTELT